MSRLAWTRTHETLIWASKGRAHTFNYELVNSLDPAHQLSSVWRIPPYRKGRSSTVAILPGNP